MTGDYDKDGFTDVLLCGNGPAGRYTMLLRNVNGDHFEEARVFHPLPFDEELTKKGIYEQLEDTTDPETGADVPGAYIDKPTLKPMQMSHGSVVFIDLDGDSWLDVVVTGYAEARENMGGKSPVTRSVFYKNLQKWRVSGCDKFLLRLLKRPVRC